MNSIHRSEKAGQAQKLVHGIGVDGSVKDGWSWSAYARAPVVVYHKATQPEKTEQAKQAVQQQLLLEGRRVRDIALHLEQLRHASQPAQTTL